MTSKQRPISTTRAAAWLGVTEETLRAWVVAGEIAFVDMRLSPTDEPGPKAYFTIELLEDLVRRRTKVTTTRQPSPAKSAARPSAIFNS